MGRQQRSWLDRLERDYPNLRGALAYLTEHAPAQAVEMAGDLGWLWEIRGYAPEARRRLADALAAAPSDSRGRAQALFTSGRMAYVLGDPTEAEPLFLEALSRARDDGEERLAISAMSNLGWIAGSRGDLERAAAHGQQAVTAARGAGDDWALGVALNNYALCFWRTDAPRARELLEEALHVRRRIREPRAIALTAANLAELVLNAGELDYADTINEAALQAAREIHYKAIIAYALGTRAVISLVRDDIQSAGAQLQEAIATARDAHEVETAALLLSVAGTVAAMQHAPISAAKLWSASDRLSRDVIEEALAAIRLRAQWQPQARAAAPDQTIWDAAWTAGAELSLDDALELAHRATDRSMPGISETDDASRRQRR